VAELRMSDYGIARAELPALARKARETMGGLFACDPAPLSDADVVAILEASYR
jgi:alcohol dehydrogenase